MKTNNDKVKRIKYRELGKKLYQGTMIKAFPQNDNEAEWPAEWKHIYFKSYPRLKNVKLDNKKSENPLLKVIKTRRSERQMSSYKISSREISDLLLFSAGIVTKQDDRDNWSQSRRVYPSAGARYPLELYPIILNANDIKNGLYHYNVKNHSLEELIEGNYQDFIGQITGQEWVSKASLVLVITVVANRSVIKYRERAYRYFFFEAGHLAQNLYLLSARLNLRCCAIGGFIDKEINDFLDIDSNNEFAVYMVAIGK